MNLMMAIIMNNIFKKQMSLQMVPVVIIVTMAEKPILKTLFIGITLSKSFKSKKNEILENFYQFLIINYNIFNLLYFNY